MKIFQAIWCNQFLSVTQRITFSFLRHNPFSLHLCYFSFKPSFFPYLYLRYIWHEGLILNIYSLRLVCGIYFNLLYIIVCFWLSLTINLLKFIALWLIRFHVVLALNLWILWRVYWGCISCFSSHLHFLFKFLYVWIYDRERNKVYESLMVIKSAR